MLSKHSALVTTRQRVDITPVVTAQLCTDSKTGMLHTTNLLLEQPLQERWKYSRSTRTQWQSEQNGSVISDHTHSEHTHSEQNGSVISGHSHSEQNGSGITDHTHSEHTHSEQNGSVISDHTHSQQNRSVISDHTHSEHTHSEQNRSVISDHSQHKGSCDQLWQDDYHRPRVWQDNTVYQQSRQASQGVMHRDEECASWARSVTWHSDISHLVFIIKVVKSKVHWRKTEVAAGRVNYDCFTNKLIACNWSIQPRSFYNYQASFTTPVYLLHTWHS